jgi:hypothetical protein
MTYLINQHNIIACPLINRYNVSKSGEIDKAFRIGFAVRKALSIELRGLRVVKITDANSVSFEQLDCQTAENGRTDHDGASDR